MPLPRVPFAEISGNSTSRREHSTYVRGQVVALRESGQTLASIYRQTRVPIRSIRDIIAQQSAAPTDASQPRCGRPKCASEGDICLILREV